MSKHSALAAETNEYVPQSRAGNGFKIVGTEAARTNSRAPRAKSFENHLDKLQTVALSLVSELKALGTRSADIDVRAGINFYDEVSRFEADLIRQALIYTDGHQVRAARLLGLGVTTLNSMIKRYKISPHYPTRDGDAESNEDTAV